MLRCAFVYFCLGVLLCFGFDSVCGSLYVCVCVYMYANVSMNVVTCVRM